MNVRKMNDAVRRANQKRSLALVIVVAARGIILQIAMPERIQMETNLIQMRIKSPAQPETPYLKVSRVTVVE
jgi:hypothetical protein